MEIAMRFDLVDLQLFIAWPRRAASPAARSVLILRWRPQARGSRSPGNRPRTALLTGAARRGLSDRGRRKPVDHCPDHPPQCRCDARRIFVYASGARPACICLPTLGSVRDCEALRHSAELGYHSDIEEREARYRRGIATGAGISALAPSTHF